MKIEMNGKAIVLATRGCYCPEDVEIAAKLQEKTVTANGEVAAEEGFAGLGRVIVDVPVPEGYLRPTGTLDITANGQYDVNEKSAVTVRVEPMLQEKTVTAPGQVLPDEGYKGLSSVTVSLPVYDGSFVVENITVNGTEVEAVTVDGTVAGKTVVKGATV